VVTFENIFLYLLTPEDQPRRLSGSLTEQLVQHQQQLTQHRNLTEHQEQLTQHQNLTQHQQLILQKQHQLRQHHKSSQLQTPSEYVQQVFPKQLTQHQQLQQPHSLTNDQYGSLIKVIKIPHL
jgi:hypothetical protein